MLAGTAAKAAPAVLPPVLIATSYLGLDGHALLKTAGVLLGIGFGAMWRAGMLRSEGKSWAHVRSDLAVSGLIGGGNAILCLAIVELFGLGALLAMGTGVMVGATGLRALPALRSTLIGALQRWALGNNVALIQPDDQKLPGLLHELDVLDRHDDHGPHGHSDGLNGK